MTAPSTTRSVEELLPQAREIVSREGRVPSKDRLMDTFRIGRPKAGQIHERLRVEAEHAKARRRAAATRIRRGKGAVLRRPPRPDALPMVPVSPGMGPVADMTFPQPTPVAEGVTASMPTPLPRSVLTGPIPGRARRRAWPILLLALPAFVAIWSGWVDLGRLTGFGVVHPLPGIWDSARLNTAITLPIGLETYAAYSLRVWLSGTVPAPARVFAKWSAVGSLVLGAAGQVAYHLMVSAGMTSAPWWITTVVACLPVLVLGMGAALHHLVHEGHDEKEN